MIKLLDRYIIGKFLGTFFYALILIISISIIFDASDNIDEFIERDASLREVLFDYYLNFIPYFANLFSPLFVFISVIYFTSRMATNVEIISILSSGVSFNRFLRPYLISATILAIMSYYFNNFLIPDANKVRLEFTERYLKHTFRNKQKNIHIQIQKNSFVYFESYNVSSNIGYKFSLERFDEERNLTFKLISDYAKWDTTHQHWQIQNYYIREIDGLDEKIRKGLSMDTVINLKPADFNKRNNVVESLDYWELNSAIEKEKLRGSEQVVYFEIEKQKRIAFPFATFVLTIIGVSIASRKVRGGIGMHIMLGFLFSFSYIFFMQISTTFALKGGMSPVVASWIPNLVFGIISLYLLKKAPK